jgi:hypothetical protein
MLVRCFCGQDGTERRLTTSEPRSGGSVPRILVPPLARLRSSKGTEPRAYAHG